MADHCAGFHQIAALHEHPQGATEELGRAISWSRDPARRAIVEKLSQGPISVSRLADPLDITLAAVVQHLQVLQDSGLVQTRFCDGTEPRP